MNDFEETQRIIEIINNSRGKFILKQKRKFQNQKKIKIKQQKDGCIICTSHKSEKNHRLQIRFLGDKKHHLLTRLIFEINNKKSMKKKLFVCHRCNNGRCININHLYQGNQKDNMHDRVMDGKYKPQFCNGKLTEKQVKEIRILGNLWIKKRYKKRQLLYYEKYRLKQFFYIRNHTLKELGKKYNVDKKTICNILKNNTWKHLPKKTNR